MQKNGSGLFSAPILKFWVSHRGQRGEPPKRLSRNRPKTAKNGQKTTKIVSKNIHFFKFSKWIKVAPKWSKMAQKRILGPFGPVFVSFGSVPPSIWGVPPSGWGHPALPGIRLGGTPWYMWCPHARLDTENELPRAKPIPLE